MPTPVTVLCSVTAEAANPHRYLRKTVPLAAAFRGERLWWENVGACGRVFKLVPGDGIISFMGILGISVCEWRDDTSTGELKVWGESGGVSRGR